MDTTIINTTSYLTFNLGNKIYGLNVSRVLNIVEMSRVSINKRTGDLIIGYLSLRGLHIPVADIRAKFNISQYIYNDNACVLVVNIVYLETDFHIGILVDSLCEVSIMKNDDIEMNEDVLSLLNIEGLAGLYKRADWGFINIIDPDSMFSNKEINAIIEKAH